MPIKKRQAYIHARLSRVQDADLIAWWEGVPQGEGSDILKAALRAYLKGGQPKEAEPATRGDLEQMAAWLVEQMKGMAIAAPAAAIQDDKAERLSKEEAQERERNIRKRKW